MSATTRDTAGRHAASRLDQRHQHHMRSDSPPIWDQTLRHRHTCITPRSKCNGVLAGTRRVLCRVSTP